MFLIITKCFSTFSMIQEWPEFLNAFEYWVQRKTRSGRVWRHLTIRVSKLPWATSIFENQWISMNIDEPMIKCFIIHPFHSRILKSENSDLRSCLDYRNVKKKINFEELELPAYVNPCQPVRMLWRFYLRFMMILQNDLANVFF